MYKTSNAMLCYAKSLQSCPTLCDPIDSGPPGSPVPGILQARTLEWVAISFSNAGKWKVKVKSLSHVRLLATPWTAAWDFPGKSTGVGCHCLLRKTSKFYNKSQSMINPSQVWYASPLPNFILFHIMQNKVLMSKSRVLDSPQFEMVSACKNGLWYYKT